MTGTRIDVVVPTVGRPTLARLIAALVAVPGRVLVVDDRPGAPPPLRLGTAADVLGTRLVVLRSGGRGPAAARNVGWRASDAEWIACLDDDVLPFATWTVLLLADLMVGSDVGASQGRVRVPPPLGRKPTDRERAVRGLERAPGISANMAYRRTALADVGGFDEGFPRAYREDSDVALRLRRAGWRIVAGRRRVHHPAWPAGPWASLRAQAGNADDARLRARYGPAWRRLIGAPPGRGPQHAMTTAAALLAVTARPAVARAGAAVWLLSTLAFAWRRIAPGPRTPREIATMLVTSALIPPLALGHRARGAWRARRRPVPRPPRAVLLDRDGTLIVDVPGNADPMRVTPMPGARRALDRLRAAGVRLAVVTNQAAVGEGRLTAAALARINARVDALLGPFHAWVVCAHAADAGCACRKPQPGAVREALARLGARADDSVLIGDVGSDVAAARAAGVRAILVPTPVTLPHEVRAAPEVARDLDAAVRRLLEGA